VVDRIDEQLAGSLTVLGSQDARPLPFASEVYPVSDRSAIEWTDATWNPVTGCSKVSPGCAHCYAETLSLRYGWSRLPWTAENAAANVVLHPDRLDQPLRWRRPRMVFVNSMSDLFHERVPSDFRRQVWSVMDRARRHTYQILTKRPELMRAWVLANQDVTIPVLPNAWLGTSIENNRWAHRADDVRDTLAAVRFISAEPLLGPLDRLDLTGIDWLIVGGESGPRHRPMDPGWVRDLRDQAVAAGVAFFFKQWGGRTPKAGGRLLDGRTWDEYPPITPLPATRRPAEQIRGLVPRHPIAGPLALR
jgi:protein gp37